MTATTTTDAFHVGALVRLALDEGPRSIGVVVDTPATRADGTLLVPIVWQSTPYDALRLAVAVVDDLVNATGYAQRLAATTLVPLCEFADAVACLFDATHTLPRHSCCPTFNVCEDHHALA